MASVAPSARATMGDEFTRTFALSTSVATDETPPILDAKRIARAGARYESVVVDAQAACLS